MTTEPEQRRFRALIEHSSNMVAVSGQEGAITYVSPSLAYWLGYQQQDLVGRPAVDVVHQTIANA